MTWLRACVVASLVIGLAILVGYRTHSARVVAAVPAGSQPATTQASEDLRRFMQARIHPEYTFLSFTIWHDRPLTAAKMDSIAISSRRVIEMARDLNAYQAAYKEQGWNKDDLKFFEDKRLQLSRVAEELSRAAQSHDSSAVINFFMHLDSTCQSCHKRFRPDLQWI